MKLVTRYISDRAASRPGTADVSTVDLWHEAAEADYKLCRAFADHYGARLPRSLHSQRIGWKRESRAVYGILLPDPLPSSYLADDDWYIYYVWGETLFRRTRQDRERLQTIVLADSVEDWAELLRQAVRDQVFDVRYDVASHYLNALGEFEYVACGYEFSLYAHAPQAVRCPAFKIAATGDTPEAAAREACRRWLDGQEAGRGIG